MTLCWIILVIGIAIFLCGAFTDDQDVAGFGFVVCILVGFLGFGLYGLGSTSKVQWAERRDFKVIQGGSFVAVEMDGRHETYNDLVTRNAIDKIKVIYVRQSWNQYGHRNRDTWHFEKTD